MRHKKLGKMVMIMICIVSPGLNGCLSTTNNEQPGSAALAVETREMAFARTMADRDMESFKGFISPEAIFFNGNEPLIGSDAIIQAWGTYFVDETAPFTWYPDVIQVLESGHLAFTSGPVLGASGEALGRFNSVWRLDEDGQWRVVFDKGS